MEKEFIPYEQALALKELGFDEPCLALFYNTDKNPKINMCHQTKQGLGLINTIDAGLCDNRQIPVPLFQQAFDWFRKKYNFIITINLMGLSSYYAAIQLDTVEWRENWRLGGCYDEVVDCYSYEEAELECLKKLIELCKKN
jgi:hypothetical protein